MPDMLFSDLATARVLTWEPQNRRIRVLLHNMVLELMFQAKSVRISSPTGYFAAHAGYNSHPTGFLERHTVLAQLPFVRPDDMGMTGQLQAVSDLLLEYQQRGAEFLHLLHLAAWSAGRPSRYVTVGADLPHRERLHALAKHVRIVRNGRLQTPSLARFIMVAPAIPDQDAWNMDQRALPELLARAEADWLPVRGRRAR